jgi:hypothetical protein
MLLTAARGEIMKTGKSLQELAVEIDRQNKVKRDYIANTSEMQMMVSQYGGEKSRGAPLLSLMGMTPFAINEVAHDQIGTKLGIPSRYYNRMLTDDPELLATNVNTWFKSEPSKRMIRTLDLDTKRLSFVFNSHKITIEKEG